MMEMIQKKISFAFIFLKLLRLVLHVRHIKVVVGDLLQENKILNIFKLNNVFST